MDRIISNLTRNSYLDPEDDVSRVKASLFLRRLGNNKRLTYKEQTFKAVISLSKKAVTRALKDPQFGPEDLRRQNIIISMREICHLYPKIHRGNVDFLLGIGVPFLKEHNCEKLFSESYRIGVEKITANYLSLAATLLKAYNLASNKGWLDLPKRPKSSEFSNYTEYLVKKNEYCARKIELGKNKHLRYTIANLIKELAKEFKER